MPRYEFDPEPIGRLLDLRALSLASMRKLIGVSPGSVKSWLKGESMPSLKSLLNMMNWYGVKPDFI
ncbi:MAG: helix-turn-helix domain-containing protein [Proteobacteria bacterium]|nr:helix-turn-helix domain-containing protein [Pseudomonadota bacterium]